MRGTRSFAFADSRTPDASLAYVKRFCNSLVPGARPLALPYTPELGAEPQECFKAVRSKVETAGGDIVYGWSVHEWPEVLIEGEFHAVWRDTDGVLHDIALQQPPIEPILFVPDPVRRFEGTPFNNVRCPLRDHPAIHRLIQAHARLHEEVNRDGRRIRLSPDELDKAVEGPMAELHAATLEVVQIQPGRNDRCSCGSGRKFKKCCGST
jgi:hypothetical protein